MQTNNIISHETVPIVSLGNLAVGEMDSIQRLTMFLYPRIVPVVRFFLNFGYRLSSDGIRSWFGTTDSIEFESKTFFISAEHFGLCFEIAHHYLALEPKRFELRFLQDRLGENCDEREPKQYHITGSNFASADAVNRHLCKAVIGPKASERGEWPYKDKLFIKRSNVVRYGLVFFYLNRQGNDTKIGHLCTGPAAVCDDKCEGQDEITTATGICPRSLTYACSSRLNVQFPYRFFANGDRKLVPVSYCCDCKRVVPAKGKVAAICTTCGKRLSKRNCWVPHNGVDYAALNEGYEANSKHHEEQFDHNEEQKILHERDKVLRLLLNRDYPETANWLRKVLPERSELGELNKKQRKEFDDHHRDKIAYCKTKAMELVLKRRRQRNANVSKPPEQI